MPAICSAHSHASPQENAAGQPHQQRYKLGVRYAHRLTVIVGAALGATSGGAANQVDIEP